MISRIRVCQMRHELDKEKNKQNQISSYFEAEHKSRVNYRLFTGSASSQSLFLPALAPFVLLL